MINFNGLSTTKLCLAMEIKAFHCSDVDLNNFLKDDALHYHDERMAITYILEYEKQTVGYFCLLNDKVVFDTADVQEKSFWNRFNRKNRIPNPKRHKNYPAVKIGRLAVANAYERQGIGKFILDGIKAFLAAGNDIGCRFLTVDAYNTAFDFYVKNQFHFISDKDKNENTRLMYFDLKQIY